MARKKKKSKEKRVVSDSGIEIEIKEKRESVKAPRIAGYLVLIIILLALFYVFTSTKEVESVELKNYTITKQYQEEVPYTIREEYQTREPYGIPYCSKTRMNFTTTKPSASFENGEVICRFNLTNTDLKEGTWEYKAYLPSVTGNRYDKKTVGPNETVTFSFNFGTTAQGPFACGFSAVSLPSIERCYFPESTFYRVVTKTRNITKHKNVTREKEVTVLNETIVKKNINRFFRYEMPDLGW